MADEEVVKEGDLERRTPMLGINGQSVQVLTDFEAVDGKGLDLRLAEHPDCQLVSRVRHVRVQVSVEVSLSHSHVRVLRIDQFELVSRRFNCQLILEGKKYSNIIVLLHDATELGVRKGKTLLFGGLPKDSCIGLLALALLGYFFAKVEFELLFYSAVYELVAVIVGFHQRGELEQSVVQIWWQMNPFE